MAYREKLVLDTEKVIKDFLLDNARYQIVIRGQRLIIEDAKTNKDVVEMKFDEENKQEVQTKMEGICASLNNGEIIMR
jgi:hypothetical protein